MKTKVLALLAGCLTLGANVAMADGWPGTITGNWSVLGNQSSGTLSITYQGTSGLCRPISGTIYNNPIQGFYCPYSGRIHFVRKDGSNNDTFQVWTGNVSQDGVTDRMGGTFTSVNSAIGGSLGEYNFQAAK